MPSQSTIIFDKHYTPDILQIQKKNLVYRNPESDFSVQAEFVTGHIYNIVVKGNANIHDIRITLEIGDLLITRLREKGYSGNFHSIITINDLNSITPEARKMVLKKMDQWQEFEAFIMVGANAFIKTLINVYKRFNPSFKVFFANDQNFALDNIIKLISKSLNVLQQKFLDKNFISKNNWYWKSTNGDYSIKISFLDENIYIVEPKGYAQNSDVEHANKLFNSVLDENNPNREKYYRIQDYSQMTGASKLARQIFVNWMKENINQMHLSVFYGLTGVMKTIVLFGKVLYPNSSKIHIAKSLREALNIVSKHKNGIDLSDETTELIKSDFVIPESKEELTDMLQILIDENSLLKSFNEENSRKLFEIVAKISWDYNLDTQNENIVGEPFSDLFNAIQMLKNDVNDLLKEREFHIAQLTESEEKYYSLFDSSPDSILIIEENTISDCNKKALDIFKLAKKQIVGKRISDFLTDDSDIIFDFFP
ncbi:MAG: PAS domain-containing protein, partial [Bacteroidota bacterium]